MELFYYISERGNFGDDLNVWLWDDLLPGWRGWESNRTIFGAGTIANSGFLSRYDAPLIIGSGTGYGSLPGKNILARCDIRAVRGPRSAKALGLPETIPMLDPAIMIPLVEKGDIYSLPAPTQRTIFIPHYTTASLNLDWQELCEDISIEYVAPEGGSKEVISKISKADLVLTESMHGAILADAYRVPWVPLRINDKFNTYKWQDWGDSLDLELSFVDIFKEVRGLGEFAIWSLGRVKASKAANPQIAKAEPSLISSLEKDSAKAPARRNRLKVIMEIMSPIIRYAIQKRLQKAMNIPPNLSEESILRARQDGFASMLEGVIRDYR